MSDTPAPGGFTGDPAAALAVTGTSGCCGNPPRTTDVLTVDPATPCCGTPADAEASGSCCGARARAEAVAGGSGCCG